MTRETSVGTARKLERAQSAVEMLIKEPVKQAVREALAEERAGERPTGADSSGQSSNGANRRLRPKLLLSLLGIVTAALYWRRRKAGDLDMSSGGQQSTDSTDATGADEEAESTEQDTEEEATSSS